jgi:signal transduction histidine kinase
LRKQVDLLDRVHGASVRYLGEPVPHLPAAREDAVYRVAQEALHNALRHGQPAQVTVDLRAQNGSVVLMVTDDGLGFDPLAADGAARRLGLDSMRERARLAGGQVRVSSRPGSGTTVVLTVPLGGGDG